jgi:hypothetical protein
MKRFPSSRGSLHRWGQVEWQPAQFSENSAFPLAALARLRGFAMKNADFAIFLAAKYLIYKE